MASTRGTTILLVRRDAQVAVGGDGQVSLGETIIKTRARKIRRLYDDRVIVGFAGATADAFSLFARFENKLDEFQGNLSRAAVELSKEWRTDRVLRHLEALLIATDKEHSFLISGNGDLIEPDDGVMAIGSGGPYALAAARALLEFTDKTAPEIVEEALKIAADICVYSNRSITVEVL